MTIKEIFNMLEKHNKLAEIFSNPQLKPRRIYIVSYGYDSHYFNTFEQYMNHVLDEFVQPVARQLLNADIKKCDDNYLIGVNDDGKIIMSLGIFED